MTMTVSAGPSPADTRALKCRGLPTLVAYFVVAATAAVPRLFNPLALDPFVDEVGWLRWAIDVFQWTDPGTWWTPLKAEGRPPLYLWILAAFRDLDDNAFVAGRMAAALISVAASVAVCGLGTTLFSLRVGALAGVLSALSPFSVMFARIASSDDVLLCLLATCVAISSVRAARAPSLRAGLLCGLTLGLAIMSKTTGVLALATPLLAVATLGRVRCLRAYGPPLAVAGVVTLVIASPLLIWLRSVYASLLTHADLSATPSAVAGTSADVLRLDLLQANARVAGELLLGYLGWPLLLAAGAGLMLALAPHQPGLRFLVLVLGFGLLATLDRTTTFFSRYLLSIVFPLYLMAAYALVWVADSMGRTIAGTPSIPRAAIGARHAALALITGAVVWPMVGFTWLLAVEPTRAPLPGPDRWQYVENKYVLYGLADIVGLLEVAARSQPIIVLLPQKFGTVSDENWNLAVEMPHQALRLWMRHKEGVHFEAQPRGRSDQRPSLRASGRLAVGSTFVIVNEIADPPDQAGLLTLPVVESLQAATLVVRIPRPLGPSRLSVYRLD